MSTRYLPATALLVGMALVPTIVHTYVGVTAADGRSTAGIARQLDGVVGLDTNRSAVWVKEIFGADDFIERRYGTGTVLFVARGYDAKQLYHHPELGAAYGVRYDSTRVVHVPAGSGPIAVHLLTGDRGTAAYALLYDGTFIENAMSFQVRQAFSMLLGPRRPTTLFFAHGPGSSEPSTSSPIVRLVVAAVESFLAQRSPGPK